MVEKNTGEFHAPPPPSTPRVAPWDAVQELCNRLDRLIAILETWTGPGYPGGEVTAEIATIWEAGPIQEMLAPLPVRAAGISNTEMLEWTRGKRLIIKITSTLDQAIVVQPVGNIRKAITDAVNINGPLPCAALSNITIGFAWDDWHPYIGAILTIAVAPTQGSVKVEAVIQE